MFSVLIVDDETLVRDTLTRFIRWQDIGFDSVRCAENGLRALEAIRQEPPSVIISDIKMPHMNGIDFANRAREICPQSKLVFLSGYSDKEYLKGAISLKVDGHIEKPIDIGQIVALMTQLREECWKEYISSNPAIAFFRGPAQALTPLNDQVFHLSKERLGAFYTLIKAKEQSEAMAFFDALSGVLYYNRVSKERERYEIFDQEPLCTAADGGAGRGLHAQRVKKHMRPVRGVCRADSYH